MAIVPINKITLYGMIDQKEAVLEGLQRLGCAHLINLTPETGTGQGRPSQGFSVEAQKALQYLNACPTERRQAKNPEDFDFAAVEHEALDIQRQHQELADEGDLLAVAINAAKPWGEFHLPSAQQLGALRLWFYIVPHHKMEIVRQKEPSRESDLVWQVVARDERFDYVIVVQPDEPQGMPVAPTQLDSRSLSQLTQRLKEVELELESLHWRRVELTRWSSLMTHAMAQANDQAALAHAGQQTWDESRIFAVQGWAPRGALPQIEEFAQQHALALSSKEPEPDDNPPTLLNNPELLAGGESTVTFYMTPGYHTWDPSIVVFFSFAVFFAMIFADAGYALMLGGILVLMWRKLSHTRSDIRMRNLYLVLVVASVAYGVMVGSYFGVRPAEGSLLSSLTVLDTKDQGGMMLLSIIVGVLHLVLANLVTAWRYRRSFRFLAPLGWVAMILGGLIAGFNFVGDTPLKLLLPFDVILLAGGAGLILFFSSERPFSASLSAWGLRLLDGLMNLTGISKAFGDVLSYLRLFALGLASSQLAATFNEIAGGIAKSRGIGLLVAILVLVVGHGLNFVLAVIGGVVHGLRLNCIEFFNWSLPDEGYAFEVFNKKASQ